MATYNKTFIRTRAAAAVVVVMPLDDAENSAGVFSVDAKTWRCASCGRQCRLSCRADGGGARRRTDAANILLRPRGPCRAAVKPTTTSSGEMGQPGRAALQRDVQRSSPARPTHAAPNAPNLPNDPSNSPVRTESLSWPNSQHSFGTS